MQNFTQTIYYSKKIPNKEMFLRNRKFKFSVIQHAIKKKTKKQISASKRIHKVAFKGSLIELAVLFVIFKNSIEKLKIKMFIGTAREK